MNGKISNFQQVASLRRYTMSEGKQKGVDVIDCDNGALRFLLNVSKGLDVMQLYHMGKNISFISKNGFSAREHSFLNRFEGGMVYTCGLDSVGGREGYELHGSYHNIPAEVICAQCDEQGIRVEALIRDTALFGRNLVMHRTITSGVESNCVHIEDKLTNMGHKEESYCLLYHTNIGYPMLDEGATICMDEQGCVPRTPWSEENMSTRALVEGPVADTQETCYFMTLGKPEVSLINPKLGKKFTLSYSKDTLPCFVEWKSMVSGDYALGLEPATTMLDDRFAYKTIGVQETIKFDLCLSVEEL